MGKLTDQQRSTLKLIERTRTDMDGWAKCGDKVYEQLIAPMPDDLVEKDTDQLKVRLTPEAKTLLAYM